MGDTGSGQGFSGVRSFLFTDIEQSSVLWDRDPAAMRLALELHDDILRQVAARHDGHVFFSGGDGFGIAFASASAAVAAAVEVQVALAGTEWPSGLSLRVRMGVHTGAIERRDGNYFGPTLNRAARLSDAGHGGQVLLSGVTAALISPEIELVELGSFELKGVREPERIWWLPVPETGSDFPPLRSVGAGQMRQPPVPTRLRFDGDTPFAGRQRPLDHLSQAWQATREGSSPVVLVSGEPGVGKTRLVAEAASRMHADGAALLYGRCDPHLGVPHQPFAEALSAVADGLDTSMVRTVLAPYGGELCRLVPRLDQLVPGLAPPLEGDASGNRHRMFTAVGDALSALAERSPGAVLVIDDFHWADPSTIALLEHLAVTAAPPGVMVVVIHRHTDVPRHGAVEQALSSLRRRSGAIAVHLGGLTLGDVEELVVAAGPELAGIGPVAGIYSRTGGNPFFITELIRHLASGATSIEGVRHTTGELADSIPPGVSELVRERLQALPDRTIEILEAAAIFGQEFDVRFLAHVQGVDVADALAALEPAVSTGLVQEPGRGRFAFAQVLVRMVIYDDLAPGPRVSGHVAAARAFEALGHSDQHLPALAYHWGEAAMAGFTLKAVTSAMQAGEQAVRATAYGAAVEHLRAARTHADDLVGTDGPDRVEIQLRLAEALNMASRLDEAEAEFIDAAAQAHRAGRADLLARAALGLGGDLPSTPPANTAAIALVEQALAVHPDSSPTRALLLARLAEWRHRLDPGAARLALVDEAVAVARSVGDDELLARVMLSRVRAMHGPDAMADMLTISREVDRIATRLPDDALAVRSAQVRMNASFVLGDLSGAVQAARITSVLARRLRQPEYERLPLMWDAFQAMYEGRFDAGSAIAHQLAELLGSQHSQTASLVGALLLPQMVFEGRSEEAYEITRGLDVSYREALLAWFAAETGALDRARHHLAELGSVEGIVADTNWSWWMGMVSAVTAAQLCGETSILAEAREAIGPWASQQATAGLVTYLGSGHHHLGVAELGLGNHEAAIEQLGQAILVEEMIGARPFAALSMIELAKALDGRGGPGDLDRAAEMRAAALETADEIGLESVHRRA